MIGPNGAGKSTLLKILAGREKPDAGTVSSRRGVRIGYVPQEEEFAKGATVEGVLAAAIAHENADEMEAQMRVEIALASASLDDRREQAVDTLSGGWRKRLSIMREVIREPELLFLDEPTNHLDLGGVLWLEEMLNSAPWAFAVITHDRYFLENVSSRMVELNPVYADGYLSAIGSYTNFLTRREEYRAGQAHQQVALASKVRVEIAWLQRGARARTTKAKGRIESAGELIQDLAEVKQRNNSGSGGVGIAFQASDRRTKEMIAAKGLEAVRGGRTLFSHLDVTLSPRRRLGLIGPNGSGKTTLLRCLTGDIEPDAGTIKRADGLRIVWFDQGRAQLDRSLTLKDALAPTSDSVLYNGSTIHVSSWAKRFGFRKEQLASQVSFLSGGEQARILIANLMLRPADVLILDEPTNDLDIPSLEALEECLTEFPGALILVSHDRYLLDAVSTEVLVLEGGETGKSRYFADYAQWETSVEEEARAMRSLPAPPTPAPAKTAPAVAPAAPRRALTGAERKEWAQLEEKIAQAESKTDELQVLLASPAVATDAAKLQETWAALNAQKEAVGRLYERYEELEALQPV